MKRKYERPMAFEETFMTNEYVAACWGVACSIDSANKVDQNNPGVDHHRLTIVDLKRISIFTQIQMVLQFL